jgi:tetratricopeptide (TPR) repeat protein
MKGKAACAWTIALVLTLANAAGAQTGTGTTGTTTAAGTTGTTTAAEPVAPPPPALEPGMSERTPPAWVAIQRGHRAFLARDFDTALAAYREAAMATPPLPIAHYFIGAAQRAKGSFDEAIESFRTVSRLAGDTDPALKAKALANIAWTLEAKQDLTAAREAWLEYKTWCTTHASIPGFPQIADERVAAIDVVKALDQTYEAVRQRIADRERVVAEQAAQAAANPPAE